MLASLKSAAALALFVAAAAAGVQRAWAAPVAPGPSDAKSAGAGESTQPRPGAPPSAQDPSPGAEVPGPGAVDPGAVDPVAVDAAIRRAIDFLLSRQELDGSWRPDEPRYVSGQTALAAYALLKCGLRADHPAVDRALRFLRRHPPSLTYECAVAIQAFDAADVEDSNDRIFEWAELLLAAKGLGFSYPGGHEDLSLTQYGCLALRVAEKRGFKIKQRVWESAGDFAERMGKDDGSFSYRPERPGTGSMTAAGIVTLQVVRDALTVRGKLRGRDAKRIDARIAAGLEWLGTHFDPSRNPNPSDPDGYEAHVWQLYGLYGLERVAGLTRLVLPDGRDWYDLCARELIQTQGDRGQWATVHGQPHPGTCFGILVLKRATATSTKPALLARIYGDDDPKRAVSIRAAGDTPLTLWVSSLGDSTHATYTWPDEQGKGPRIVSVEYIDAATGKVLAEVEGNAAEPADDGRFATRLEFKKPGAVRLVARVHVRPPGAPKSERVTLTSQEFTASISGVLSEGQRRALADAGRSKLASTKLDVSTSSVHEGHGPKRLVDGLVAQGWLCAAEDATPSIELSLKRPERGVTLALTPYWRAHDEPGAWGQPARILVEVNSREIGTFDLPREDDGKFYIDLGRRARVRTVRVLILEKHPGTVDPNLCGFAEIELLDKE